MGVSITAEQVTAMAPDAASLKAARGLANPQPWTELGQNGRSVWGACQGSGKEPYRTQVDWTGPAFKCSCPSRKFPCKHGLALLLLLAEQPRLLPTTETEPEWVKQWIATRQQKSEAKQKPKEETPVDEAARAKRATQRAARVSDGVELAELWLRDLVQQGLASAPARGFAFWDEQAARLVDAQAPGLARLVRELGRLAVTREGWQQRMIRAIGKFKLLLDAYKKLDQLPEETQADVKTAIGFQTSQAEILTGEGQKDAWFVAGQRTYQEDRLRVQRTWLVGEQHGGMACVLEFAMGTAGFKTNLLTGTVVDAEVGFFPSGTPMRALIKSVHEAPRPRTNFVRASSVDETYRDLGRRVAKNPWIEAQPVMLKSVKPAPRMGEMWCLVDSSGHGMPCIADLSLLALSGGRAVDVFGEWEDGVMRPLSVAAAGRVVALRSTAPNGV